MSSDYRFSGAFLVRLAGGLLTAIGAAVLAVVLLVLLFPLPPVVLTVGVVGGAVLVVAVLLVAAIAWRTVVLGLGETGYRVRHVRGAGVRQAAWKDVEDVVATTVSGQRCVRLRLRDGRSTTVPVEVLAVRPERLVEDLRRHLDRGHGYRRLSAPSAG